MAEGIVKSKEYRYRLRDYLKRVGIPPNFAATIMLHVDMIAQAQANEESATFVDLMMKGEALRDQIRLDAILGRFPPKVEKDNEGAPVSDSPDSL
jgi:hypothetical protein